MCGTGVKIDEVKGVKMINLNIALAILVIHAVLVCALKLC